MEIIYDASRDQRLLGAYLLGYCSRAIWYWHDFFWKYYFVGVDTTADPADGMQDAPSLVAEDIECGITVNSASISASTIILLRESVKRIAESPSRAIEAFNNMSQADRRNFLFRVERNEPPMRQEWERLKTLADAAFGEGSAISVHYEIGKYLGEYQIQIDAHPDLSEYLDLAPGILHLAEAAKHLPAHVLREMPLLAECLARRTSWTEKGPRAFFEAVFEKLDGLDGRPLQGLDHRFPLQTTLVRALHDEIRSVLEETPLTDDSTEAQAAVMPSEERDGESDNPDASRSSMQSGYIFSRRWGGYYLAFLKPEGGQQEGPQFVAPAHKKGF